MHKIDLPPVARYVAFRIPLLLSVAVANAGVALCEPPKDAANDGFVSIFDGDSLDGWSGDEKVWSVVDGAIVGKSTDSDPLKSNTFLIWDGEVGDFVLKLKFMVADRGVGNSGIQYRSRRDNDAGEFVIGGYQADIDRTNKYTGILYDERGRGILANRGEKVVLRSPGEGENGVQRDVVGSVGDPDELVKDIEPGKWHDYEVVAEGNHLVHKINGRVMVDVTDEDEGDERQRGILALQVHQGPEMEIQFKDIELKKLDAKAANKPGDATTGAVAAPPGFLVEKVYSVPGEEQGSWVSLTVDDRGRLIASDQYGKLYRVTVMDENRKSIPPRVEPIELEIGMAQGLLFHQGVLYVMVNNHEDGDASGLYRVTDNNGDDHFDSVELLRSIPGGGEHGPHAIVPAPDGKSLYICAGNHTDLPPIDASRVPRHWQEDLLLPRMWDARGHARGKLAPGGWIAKIDFDGENMELVSNGFRNEYDIAFNADGELFTYDADMEWDVGAPWYRPTRVCHVTSGSEFGWRSGTGKWPDYYADSLPAVVDIGPGSPTGIIFGYGAKFPAKYQRALFICDWSYGVIYAVHMTPDGASYVGELERFTSAAPLPATDIVVNPIDGAMYFTVGGRGAQSALYRVTYVGDESTAPVSTASASGDDEPAAKREKRKSIEAFHVEEPTPVPNEAIERQLWTPLGDPDRHVRFAARIALEHQPVDDWAELALNEPDPVRRINALLALARCGESDLRSAILESLNEIDWNALDETGRLELLRAYQVTMARLGGPDDEELKSAITERLNPLFPNGSQHVNHELGRILVFLEAPGIVERALDQLANAGSQQEQIFYALILRTLQSGWTLDQRREYLAWFHKAAAHRGGMSFNGFLKNIRAESIDSMSDDERAALATEIKNVPKPAEPKYALSQRPVVKEWFMEELLPSVAGMKSGRNFENGRKMFAVGLCFRCHRVQGEGESIGPDLTGVGQRFNARDVLLALLEPNKVISDQYRQTTFVVNGKMVSGRVVNMEGNEIQINSDMLDQSNLTTINVSDVAEQFPSNVSMMPSGLLNTMNKEEILDLIAYLRSGGNPDHAFFQPAR